MSVSGILQTYLAAGNKPDVSDIIDLIAYTETPCLSTWPKEPVTNTTVEFYDYDLSSADETNSAVEGAEAGESSTLVRTKRTNITQILKKVIQVSRTQRKIAKYGNIGDELTWQQTAKLQELARDLDKAIMMGVYSAGASSDAAKMRGAEASLTTNATAAEGASLTEEMLKASLLQKIWDAGGRGDKTLYVGSVQKGKIDNFTGNTNLRVNINASAGAPINLPYNVGAFSSSFGNLKVMLTPHVTATTVSAIPDSLYKIGVFDEFKSEELAKTGDSTKVMIIGEYSLKHRNQSHGGKVTGLSAA